MADKRTNTTYNKTILAELHADLFSHADKKTQAGAQRWFKEKIKSYGVKTPVVRRIAKAHLKKIKTCLEAKPGASTTSLKPRIFELAEELFKTDYNEDATVAIQWVGAFAPEFTKKDFTTFERWLGAFINNWGKDDDFCLHILHPLIARHPELILKTKHWTASKNMWLRRAAAVCFITTQGGFYATRHNLSDMFDVALALMHDQEDLVQKGYGWMLKAASITKQKEVFDFVMAHRADMSRTALRYAIEKMPQNLRRRAMEK